ncbi:MAG: site-2 protease family protein [Cyclobacteriaceae bacterium]|jgi:membrane-associated protease RseP (regulator of RpoE activity)|nr:site-2 protease family protein [Cyclobacteriaceae bacterium]
MPIDCYRTMVWKKGLLHGGLFLVTFVTTTLAGASWTHGTSVFSGPFTWTDFASGLPYSICFLTILTAHEFGHYFVARYHKVKATLPYYIPLPPLPFFFGTLGALIRLKSQVPSTRQHFDIGVAGPLAGFVVAFGFLWYGFTHLPPPEYVFQFHPNYQVFGLDYANHVYTDEFMKGGADVLIGKNLLFLFFENWVADPARVPNPHEIIHYPFLFAGFLSLVFTSINLLPMGQLDGGHVVYGLFGYKRHFQIAAVVFLVFLFYAGLGYVDPRAGLEAMLWQVPLTIGFYFFALKGLGLSPLNTATLAVGIFALQHGLAFFVPGITGYSGWLLFAFLIGRFMGIAHPPSPDETPLNLPRKIIGWVALVVFVLCFSPNPINIRLIEP